jgi:hypothetical protein
MPRRLATKLGSCAHHVAVGSMVVHNRSKRVKPGVVTSM